MSDRVQGPYRLGADIGGTFTDIVLVAPDGSYWTKKVASTPDDYARGIVAGTQQLLEERERSGESVEEIVHGTTVASNAILENKGARTALITTRGFRDVLELRRLRVPHLYSLLYEPPPPLVPRRLRLEVDERVGAGGIVVRPLDVQSVNTAIERMRQEKVQSVAVCLIHSYSSPAHERQVGDIVREAMPDVFVSLSVDVLPEIREYERTSTTVINAYLGPLVKRYIDSLARQLHASRIAAPLRIMQSSGGVMSAGKAAKQPVQMVESGPAAGVIAAHEMGLRAGLKNIITFDMGGTTAKASLIEEGKPSWTTEHEVGAGISLSSRLVKGGGHPVKVPVLDLAEVGAGGGSVVWTDRGGALKVGPHSVGSMPGPACYGFGGQEPTVTDANLVLGYINPRYLAGGAVALRPDLAKTALNDKVAAPLGLGLLDAAYGVHNVANASMMRAIRAVSTYRGRDHRDFVLVAFGGSGPVHGAQMARTLGISQVLVPPAPGVFSAVGLLVARPEQHFAQAFLCPISRLDLTALNLAYDGLSARAANTLAKEGYEASGTVWRRYADLRYEGQAYELTVETPSLRLIEQDVADLVRGFGEEHERTYGHKADNEPVEIVNLRMTARRNTTQSMPERLPDRKGRRDGGEREAYFGSDYGVVNTPIIGRHDLIRSNRRGPLIVEEYDATAVVPPDCGAWLDEWNNIVIQVSD